MLTVRKAVPLIILFVAVCSGAFGATTTPALSPVEPTSPPRTLTYTDAATLGLVEGVTEYLPVSSIGHTIIATHLRGLDLDQPMLDHQGQPILVTHHGLTSVLTLKDSVDMYNVMVQAGPIAAILLLYWRRVASLFRGLMGRDPQGLLVLRNLVVAFVPAGILGLALHNVIHDYLFNYKLVAAALVAGSVIILMAERWRKIHASNAFDAPGPELHELSIKQALIIGLCQCVALWPGTSRSMMTIVGGYFAGLTPSRAAEFSFLLGLLTLTSASGLEAVLHLHELRAALPLGPLALGIIIATIAAAVTVKWFLGWLGQRGIGAFAWYRLALAALVLGVM